MTKSTDVQANAAVTIRKDAVEASYPWMRDGSMPHTREDLIAEAVALVALVFALGIGVLIAMLPLPAQAAPRFSVTVQQAARSQAMASTPRWPPSRARASSPSARRRAGG
jgi:hypothetical protein